MNACMRKFNHVYVVIKKLGPIDQIEEYKRGFLIQNKLAIITSHLIATSLFLVELCLLLENKLEIRMRNMSVQLQPQRNPYCLPPNYEAQGQSGLVNDC